MIEIKGECNQIVCFADTMDDLAYAQLLSICNDPAFRDCRIRVMPDVHAGKGCTVGTTMTVHDRVAPAMVGVDIGCGMETVKIAPGRVDLDQLDALIHRAIPCGREIHDTPHACSDEVDLGQLRCAGEVNLLRAHKSIGTLGGGNHFIELDRDDAGDLYLVVHSGSRHLGQEVANYYQEQGRRALWNGARYQIDETLARLKAEGRFSEIQSTLRELKKDHPVDIPADLIRVEGKLFQDYIHDMKIVQAFASLNRRVMTQVILRGMDLEAVERFTTIHNYIDTDHMILRKGAVSARKGEKLLIPINMRDGSLLCVGRGNEDWNCSAPHGAGRRMSRSKAANELSMEEYIRQMAGIYSTCVTPDTLDESPMAYKDLDEITRLITPTVDIVGRIRPVYNFKACN